MIEYEVNDQKLNASVFISFVNRVWPGDYDVDKTQAALSKTLNISAYDDKKLVGCLRAVSYTHLDVYKRQREEEKRSR